MTYDFQRRRWPSKEPGKRWSSYVLGPRVNSIRLLESGQLVVSAYRTRDGDLRYTQPVTNPNSKAGPGVMYRIRVKLNPGIAR